MGANGEVTALDLHLVMTLLDDQDSQALPWTRSIPEQVFPEQALQGQLSIRCHRQVMGPEISPPCESTSGNRGPDVRGDGCQPPMRLDLD